MKNLKSSLKDLIQEKGYVEYGFLCSFSAAEGFKVETMSRRMRELCDEYPIEPVKMKSKRGSYYIGAYKWKAQSKGEFISREFPRLAPVFAISLPPAFEKKEIKDYSINGISPFAPKKIKENNKEQRLL